MFDRIKKYFSSSEPKEQQDEQLEQLRASFKTRYRDFERLLAANKRTLKLMTEIESALAGERPASMAFIRSRSTRILTNVFQIIQHLDRIAPEKYQPLYEKFTELQTTLGYQLAYHAEVKDVPLVMPLHAGNLDLVDELGGKMAALGELGSIPGIYIPPGFIVTAQAYRLFIEQSGIKDELNRIIQIVEFEMDQSQVAVSNRLQRLIIDSPLPEKLENAILTHYTALEQTAGKDIAVSVRSSAIGEDSHDMSFAGQYRSILNVKKEELLRAYKKVVAGKYAAQAMSYRLHYGIRDDEVAMCAGCMPMIDAKAGGVVYTGNPLDDSDDSVSIYSVHGLPRLVVDGTAPIDTFVVSRSQPRTILHKGVKQEHGASLADEKILELAEISLRIEEHFGSVRDIEWAVDQRDNIILLQSRPLTKRMKKQSRKEGAEVEGNAVTLAQGGTTASRGSVSGPVFIARNIKDAERFPKGAILVTDQPLPYWATLLGQAAAVVTEQGSVACHLASVAREFGVPALFSVPRASQFLTDNQVITVDADSGRIYEGKVNILLDEPPQDEHRIHGSPVYQALKGASELILPLRLVDPTASNFAPENCKTFHDITRFCHEKAVLEMFQFGVEHEFSQRIARRLFTDVATQFWIIDLDDGLAEGVDDPYFIRLEEVVSIPMTAIWRGMQLVEWEGPPPVDARGFFQVLAQSAMDTDLNESRPSRYSEGSHFMISRKYCSLQSRFGFHFATVEAMVGDRTGENYISFQFGGGGASQERQNIRSRLIAEILEENGFHAKQNKDLVSATIGGYEQKRMENALEVIGYLLVHTRQLDMVMSDGDSIEQYKSKMMTDLEKRTRTDV